MKMRLVIAIVALLVLLGGIFGIKQWQWLTMQAQMSQPLPPAVVATAKVELESWRPTLQSVGTLVAINGIDVSTEVNGIVKEIVLQSGQPVEQNEVLIRLDDAVDKAALDALRAERKLDEIQFNRSKDLLKKRVISKSEYDEAQARFDAAKARVKQQKEIIKRKVIRAPFTGLVGIRQVDVGQYIEAGNPIVSLQALDPIYVDYTLPERFLYQVAVKQEVEVKIDAIPGEVFSGKVSALDPGISRGTRTLNVRAILSNQDGRLRPGMFAEVHTLQAEAQQVLTIPRTAINYNTYGDFIFLVQSQQNGMLSVKRLQVETGEVREGRVVIRKGLAHGDQVVRAGLVKLRDGMPIKIDNSVELDDARVASE